MSSITRTATLPDSSNKSDFYSLVDSSTVGSIVNADIDASAGIVDTKLATISTAGKVNGASLTGLASIPAGAGSIPIANLPSFQFPIGFVITLGVSTNPATLLGYGTWSAITGRVIVGIDAGQTEFDTLNETGGAKTHQLTVSEMPLHGHPTRVSVVSTAGSDTTGGMMIDADYDANYAAYTGTPDETPGHQVGGSGGDTAHNNLQPYIVKYVWERTA